jgi:hypothetical protein
MQVAGSMYPVDWGGESQDIIWIVWEWNIVIACLESDTLPQHWTLKIFLKNRHIVAVTKGYMFRRYTSRLTFPVTVKDRSPIVPTLAPICIVFRCFWTCSRCPWIWMKWLLLEASMQKDDFGSLINHSKTIFWYRKNNNKHIFMNINITNYYYYFF